MWGEEQRRYAALKFFAFCAAAIVAFGVGAQPRLELSEAARIVSP